MSTIINATDITIRYGARSVLDSASLSIEEGDRIGLVGRNGCGKTTFLKLLAKLQSPDIGEITQRRDLVVSYGSFGDSFERVLVLVQEYLVLLLNLCLGVQDLRKVEWNSDVDVG